MLRCLVGSLSGLGWTSPNPLVGCTIVRDGKVVAEGAHLNDGEAHAERLALLSLSTEEDRQAGRFTPGCARDATLYVNLEPCSHHGRTPPCTDAIIEAGVASVVFGTDDADPRSAGKACGILRAAGIETASGVLGDECRRHNELFFNWHKNKRPFVALKAAVSSDGMAAGADGSSVRITGGESQAYAHVLRQTYDAILVGSGTWKNDNPQLTVRTDVLAGGGVEIERPRDPVVIALDSRGEIDESYAIARPGRNQRGTVALVVVTSPGEAFEALKKRFEAREDVAVALDLNSDGRFDLLRLIKGLPMIGVYSILVEGGPKVWASIMNAGLADKYHIFVSGRAIGNDGLPAFKADAMTNFPYGLFAETPIVTRLGGDLLFEGHPART